MYVLCSSTYILDKCHHHNSWLFAKTNEIRHMLRNFRQMCFLYCPWQVDIKNNQIKLYKQLISDKDWSLCSPTLPSSFTITEPFMLLKQNILLHSMTFILRGFLTRGVTLRIYLMLRDNITRCSLKTPNRLNHNMSYAVQFNVHSTTETKQV